jgi:hypothetical protein
MYCVHVCFKVVFWFDMMLLCNISQIATGVPYSESPRTKSQSAQILIKFRRNSTCFRPVQSCHLFGWGSTPFSPWGAPTIIHTTTIRLCAYVRFKLGRGGAKRTNSMSQSVASFILSTVVIYQSSGNVLVIY